MSFISFFIFVTAKTIRAIPILGWGGGGPGGTVLAYNGTCVENVSGLKPKV